MNPIITTVPALPQGPVAPVAQVLATLTQLPPSLNHLLVGAILSGTVMGRDAKGQILLQTGQGVFGIKSPSPLPVGSTVTFEVHSAGAQFQTVILSVTAPGAARPQTPTPTAPAPAVFGPSVPETPPRPPTPGAPQQGPQTGASTAPATTPATSTVAGATVTATVIAPPGAGTAAIPSPVAPTSPGPAVANAASPSSPSAVPTATTETADALPGTTAVFARPTSPAPAADATPLPGTITSRPATPIPPGIVGAQLPPGPDGAASATSVLVRPAAAPAPASVAGIPVPPSLSGEPASGLALPTGTQVQVRVLPGLPATPNAPPGLVLGTPSNMASAAPVVPAAIVGRTPQGQTIVETPVGRLAMTLPHAAAETLPGKLLALELSVITRPGSAEPPPLAARHGAMSITHEWPALKAAVSAAAASPDHTLRMALDEAVPRPGPRLAQQLMMAVAGGDTRHALIESVVKPLERAGFTELAQRIDSDLRELQKLATTPSADWRLSFVPFFDGSEIRQLRIFSRKKKNDPARKGDAGTRFVIECEHGELGALQLDGFLQKQSLDVIVRSHSDLPAWMKGDMIALFTDACGAIGMSGHLQFNAAPVFPVAPMDEIAGAGTGVLV